MPDRFGNDVQGQMETWFEHVLTHELKSKFGDDFKVAVAVLNPTKAHDAGDPMGTVMHVLVHGDPTEITASDGLLANVDHKLRFVLRTGLPSSEMRLRPDLVEPGDFPWAGAGIYRGYTGGASGLKEESDWWVFCRVVDKLIDYRANASVSAIQACKDRAPGMKYLEGDL